MQRGNTHVIWAVKGGREVQFLSPVQQETAVHEEMSKQLPKWSLSQPCSGLFLAPSFPFGKVCVWAALLGLNLMGEWSGSWIIQTLAHC